MLIAITGGIGSGKSVVSQLLRVMGFRVYDCDARAKWVMTHDALLRQQLIELFGPDTYLPAVQDGVVLPAVPDGTCQPAGHDEDAVPTLNKSYLSSQIFGHPEALAKMNACVHPAVGRDLMQQYHANLSIPSPPSNPSNSSPLPFFFESAILFESAFDRIVRPDCIWTVSAPLELRIERAMSRDHATREQVLARIASQMTQEEKEKRSDAVIMNDTEHSVTRQVWELVDKGVS